MQIFIILLMKVTHNRNDQININRQNNYYCMDQVNNIILDEYIRFLQVFL